MIIIQKNTHVKTGMSAALFALLLFFFQHILQAPLLGYLGFAFLAVAAFFLDINALCYIYALLLPNTYIIKILGIDTALVGFLLLLLVAKMLILQFGHMPLNISMMTHLLIHICFVGLTVFFSGSTSILFSLFRFVAFLLMVQFLKWSEELDLNALIEFYLLGNVMNVLLGFAYYIIRGMDIFNGHFASINNDRNYFSITLAFAITLLLIKAYEKKQLNLYMFVQLMIMMGGGILSNSRTFIIIVLPAIIILLMTIYATHQSTIMMILYSLVIVAGVFIVDVLLGDSLLQVMERFENNTMSSGNQRFDLWIYYLEIVFSSWKTALIGCGNSTIITSMGFQEVVEHNTFVQMLFTIGVLGTLSLMILYIDVYKYLVKKEKKALNFLPLVCIVLGYCTINGLYSDNLGFAIVLSCMMIGTSMEKPVSCAEDVSAVD